jgi:maltooligosyltrehalose trehalohydrolase
MEYRDSPRGEPSGYLPPTAFVAFIQNHDQIGNRAFGDRLTAFAEPEAVRAIAAVYLLLPQIPMIFMGEEFASSKSFPFFCDFEPELAQAVRDGRRAEFVKFPEFQDPQQRELIPDPTSPATFQSAKLDWSEPARDGHAKWAHFYKKLLEIRRREIIPRLKGIGGNCGSYTVVGRDAVSVKWKIEGGARLGLVANLSNRLLPLPEDACGRTIWISNTVSNSVGAWGVLWTVEERAET